MEEPEEVAGLRATGLIREGLGAARCLALREVREVVAPRVQPPVVEQAACGGLWLLVVEPRVVEPVTMGQMVTTTRKGAVVVVAAAEIPTTAVKAGTVALLERVAVVAAVVVVAAKLHPAGGQAPVVSAESTRYCRG